MGFHHAGQVGLELMTSGDLSTLASQSAGITGPSHHAWLDLLLFNCRLMTFFPLVIILVRFQEDTEVACVCSLLCLTKTVIQEPVMF